MVSSLIYLPYPTVESSPDDHDDWTMTIIAVRRYERMGYVAFCVKWSIIFQTEVPSLCVC